MIGWVGGAVMDSIGRTDTAYVHRGMTELLRPTPVGANLTDAAVVTDLEAWTSDVIDVLDPRLHAVKAKWDPHGVFGSAQGLSGAS